MKIRKGFVSNSSSCSFTAVGVYVKEGYYDKLAMELVEKSNHYWGGWYEIKGTFLEVFEWGFRNFCFVGIPIEYQINNNLRYSETVKKFIKEAEKFGFKIPEEDVTCIQDMCYNE